MMMKLGATNGVVITGKEGMMEAKQRKNKYPPNLFMRRGSWYYSFIYKHQRYSGCLGPLSLTMAKEELHRRKTEAIEHRLRPGKTPDLLFEKFMDEFLVISKNVRNPVSARPLLRYFSGKRLSQITPWLVEKYKNERRKEVAPATVNRELAALKHLFNLALRAQKSTGTNPVKEVKFMQENNQRTRTLLPEEEDLLLESAAAVSPYLRSLILLALHTGARLGEILNLRWKDVDPVKNLLTFVKTKNGYSRSVPLNRKAQEVIEELRKRNADKEYLFPGATVPSIEWHFKKSRTMAGIMDFRFHDLRHTFATRLAGLGADPFVLKELLGHRTMAMTARYINPLGETKRRAVEMLEKVTSKVTSLAEISGVGR